MSTARPRLAVAGNKANGSHVSSCEFPLVSRAWGTFRLHTPLPAHRLETDR